LSLLSYLAIITATFLIAREGCRQDVDIAAVAVILIAANPILADLACCAVVHMPFLAVSLWSIYLAMKQKPVGSGLLAGVAIWMRCVWILCLIPLLCLRGRKAWQGWAVAGVLWSALGLATLNYHRTWFYSTNKLSFAAGLYNIDMPDNPGLWDQRHQKDFMDKSLLQIVLYDPSIALKSIGRHIVGYGGRILVSLVIPPMGLFAIYGLRRRYWTSLRNPLIYWTAASFALLVISFWGPQYVIGFVPLLSIAAAAQIVHLPWPQFVKWAPRVLVYATTILGMALLIRTFNEGPRDVKRAALYLKSLPGDSVIARDPRVFYYSGKKPGYLCLTRKGEMLTKGNFIVVSPYEIAVNDTLKTVLRTAELRNRVAGAKYYSDAYVLRLRSPRARPAGQDSAE